jgi:hypothetical protein
MILGECLPGIFEQLNQRGPADPGEPRHSPKGNAFRHHLEGLGALVFGQPVHTVIYA